MPLPTKMASNTPPSSPERVVVAEIRGVKLAADLRLERPGRLGVQRLGPAPDVVHQGGENVRGLPAITAEVRDPEIREELARETCAS